jgi:hypothetical protein
MVTTQVQERDELSEENEVLEISNQGKLLKGFDNTTVRRCCPGLFERSVNFEMSFWCLQFFQKTNLEILIFALAY